MFAEGESASYNLYGTYPTSRHPSGGTWSNTSGQMDGHSDLFIKAFPLPVPILNDNYETNIVRSFNIFTCLSWFTASHTIQAPLNDLKYFGRLKLYKSINSTVANVAIKTLCHHTWYLSEQLIAFSFFDDQICADTKGEMVQAMKRNVDVENHPK